MITELKFFKKLKYPFIFDKRQRFAIQTIFLTAGILTTQIIWEDFRFVMVGILSIITYILTVWSLAEDIKGTEWILLFILPVMFTASLSLFYFLLPARWIIRIILTTIFAIGSYAILLVENINNVAAERSIQLIRAAQSIGLLASLVVLFFSANVIYSLRLSFWQNLGLIFIVSFVLSLQSFWSVILATPITGRLIMYSGIVGLILGEIAFCLSFWPITNSSYALLIAASYYSLVGLLQHHLLDKFFINMIREYIFVFIFTLILALFVTRWG
ncbi:hypothetical protein A2Y99_04995 [Candidatus Gottesmanbacteria bacterium RBG_13_37_7]|uniref:Uncharacterized protein n=1 Tax=Candidatus Gottesmanbacteria bacterium RBG_13_37_7 TaxID=1798369 RepID=A0A1F5YG52_9BACT|nr:MAG: hypothetical protein A2Y99_04995 [Candidatus Gottesmanbacteria bacterium RBG_13_37_7]